MLRLRGSAALHCIRPSLTNPTPMLIPSSLHTAVPLVTNRSYSYVNPDSPVFTLPRTPHSRYYHWKPTNATLVWDRLPMTLAFMTVFAIMIDERLGAGIGGKVRSYFVHTPTRPSDHTSCSRARIGRATVGNDGESRRHMSRIFRGEIKSLPLPPLHVLILHFFLSVFLPFPPLSSPFLSPFRIPFLLSFRLSFIPSPQGPPSPVGNRSRLRRVLGANRRPSPLCTGAGHSAYCDPRPYCRLPGPLLRR